MSDTLHVGDHVCDREADEPATMLVVGRPVERADEYVVSAEGMEPAETVADYNRHLDYPGDDHVIEVVYPGRGDLDLETDARYAFPRSRLEQVAAVHDAAPEVDA